MRESTIIGFNEAQEFGNISVDIVDEVLNQNFNQKARPSIGHGFKETLPEVAGAATTVCWYGPLGLPVYQNFRDRMEELRATWKRGWALCGLAVVNQIPKRVFAGWAHLAFMYANLLCFCIRKKSAFACTRKRSVFYSHAFLKKDAPAILKRQSHECL